MDPQTDNLKEWVENAAQGDRQAFSQLYDHLSDKLFAFVIGRVSQREIALDLLQDIFVDLWLALPRFTFRSIKQFYSFVFLIARRRLAKHYRKQEVWLELSDEHIKDNYELPDPNLHQLVFAVNKLPVKLRDVVWCRYFMDMSLADTAEYLGIGLSAVKLRQKRALSKLKKLLQHYD